MKIMPFWSSRIFLLWFTSSDNKFGFSNIYRKLVEQVNCQEGANFSLIL